MNKKLGNPIFFGYSVLVSVCFSLLFFSLSIRANPIELCRLTFNRIAVGVTSPNKNKPLFSPAGRFIPTSELGERFGEAIDRAYQLFLLRVKKTNPSDTIARKDEERRLFSDALKETMGDRGFRVLDTPHGWTIPGDGGKRVPLPIHLVEAFTFDHHGPFLKFGKNVPHNNEKRNTSKQLLDFISSEVGGLSGQPLAIKIMDLQKQFSEVSTDNLGDGALAIWISRNLDLVARNSRLRAELSQLTFFEDFGFFGTKFEKIANQTDNKNLILAIKRQKALFVAYDQILKEARNRANDPALGLNTSDRFGQLGGEEQHRIVEKAILAIDRIISDPIYAFEEAGKFDLAIEKAQKKVPTMVAALREDVVKHLVGVASSDRETSMGRVNQQVERLLEDTFITYDIDPNATEGGGRFATWGAVPRAHDKPNQVSLIKRPDGKTGFIFAHPHGRPVKHQFKEAAEEIKRVHLERLGINLRNSGMTSDAVNEALQRAPFDVVSRPGPSDFFFSFNGVLLSPAEITVILMKHYN
ncbi:MAG: hypothetical protein EXR74_01920 [Bdellovibrionales bacterium]|nr:hypothetical protein [Bdellovibrionales bacterium]